MAKAKWRPEFDAEFEIFWRVFPRKIGKLDARTCYERARGLATAKQILDGVEGYKAAKPEYADWCHPSTFLNQGRWMDEPDEKPVAVSWQTRCPHEPVCGNATNCQNLRSIAEFKARRTA